MQKSMAALQELIGYEVSVDPEWQLLLVELESIYPDKADLIITISGCVTAWCRALAELLDDENNEEWTEGLLERLKDAWSRLRLFIEVSQSIRTPF
jgi:hypothetical protein